MYYNDRVKQTKNMILQSGLMKYYDLHNNEDYLKLMIDFYNYWISYCIVGNPFDPFTGAIIALAALVSADLFIHPTIYNWNTKAPQALSKKHVAYIILHNVKESFIELKSLIDFKKLKFTLTFWTSINAECEANFDNKIYHLIFEANTDIYLAKQYQQQKNQQKQKRSNDNNNLPAFVSAKYAKFSNK